MQDSHTLQKIFHAPHHQCPFWEMPQALSFVSQPGTRIMISSSSNTGFGGDIPGGPFPCNILNNNSLPAWGHTSYSNRMCCDCIPQASQLCTSREKALQYKSSVIAPVTRYSKLPRSSEWGGLSDVRWLPPATLRAAAFPSPPRLRRYVAFWGLNVYHVQTNNCLSTLDCRRCGATAELSAVRCFDQTCIFRRLPNSQGWAWVWKLEGRARHSMAQTEDGGVSMSKEAKAVSESTFKLLLRMEMKPKGGKMKTCPDFQLF